MSRNRPFAQRGPVAMSGGRSALTTSKVLVVLGIATALMSVVALSLGAAHIPLTGVIKALTGSGDPFTREIIMNVRLPRVLAALIAGASLGLSGPVLQAMYANPIVDAGIVVVGPAAAVGAALAAALWPGSIIWAAVIATVCAATSALALSAVRATGTGFSLIAVAAGSAGMAILGILVSIPHLSSGRSVSSWVFGSLALADWRATTAISIGVLLGFLQLLNQARALDIASLGGLSAELLGLDIRRARARWSLAVACLIGTVVACFGVIAFVGLAVPHLLRALGIHLHAALLVCSAAAGALLLLVADTAARSAIGGAEVPVGFFVTLLGAPVLIRTLVNRAARG